MPLQLPDVIHTPRLMIRVAQPGEGLVFHEAIRASHEELRPWLDWVSPLPSTEGCEAFCRRAHASYLNNLTLESFVWCKVTRRFAGMCGLLNIDWSLRHFEIGGWMKSSFSGQGFPGECVRAMAEHCFKHLEARRVYMHIDDRNVAAWTLARRTGFKLEGTLRNHKLDVQGDWCNTRIYAQTPQDRAERLSSA